MKTIEEIWSIVNGLKELYPDGVCSLDYRKDYELLFSVRLAAQCTDERVNKVTPALYARFPTLEALAEADILPPEESNDFCHRLVLHGRAVCIARRPQCQSCVLRPWCDHFAKSGQTARGTEGREPA